MSNIDLLVTVILMVNLLLVVLLVVLSKRMLRLREENVYLRTLTRYAADELGDLLVEQSSPRKTTGDSLFKEVNGVYVQVGGREGNYRSGGYQPWPRQGYQSPGNPPKNV